MAMYEFNAKSIDGVEVSLEQFKGKVLLVVNTASKCGFTPQFNELQQIYEKYKDKGFAVLGFPCNQFMNQEPANDEEIKSFCELNYGVTFPMFAKVDVNGSQAHPLFNYLASQAPGVMGSKAIKWNFTKFLVDQTGSVRNRYAPSTKPNEIVKDIEGLL